MYKRFKESLTKPSGLILYLKDTWLRIWLYFFLLTFIMLLPTIFKVVTIETFDKHTTQDLYNMIGNIDKPYRIEDGTLVDAHIDGDKTFESSFGSYAVYINKSNQLNVNTLYHFEFQKEGLAFYILDGETVFRTYEQLNLEQFDFYDKTLENQMMLVTAFNTLYQSNAIGIKIAEVGLTTLGIALQLLLIIAVLSLFNSKPIKYKYKFKINVYAATIYAVVLLFAELFQIGLFLYLGVILMFFVSARAFSRLIGIQE